MPQRVRDRKNYRNVAASATTAIAPTVRKRPTAQVVSIDQAQRAGKYQKRPQAHGSASRNQRPATAMDMRPRAVVARARYLAMLVATTRLRASECRAKNRAIASL